MCRHVRIDHDKAWRLVGHAAGETFHGLNVVLLSICRSKGNIMTLNQKPSLIDLNCLLLGETITEKTECLQMVHAEPGDIVFTCSGYFR